MTTLVKKSLLDIHPRELKGIIRDIPTLPAIYQELLRRMQDPEVSVSAIAEIIAQDQALTAKILHLVNSAFYGYSKQIKTISRAVVILGFRAVRSAALGISVFDYFQDEESSSQVNITEFWRHSIAVGSISKTLAEILEIDQQEEAFIVGLLHDVGKLIEKRYFGKDFDDLCQAADEQHLAWFDCEKALYRINHATIGKAVFRTWDFPSSVVEAVQFHHDPGGSRKGAQLTALVNLADQLSYELGYGAPGAYPPKECNPEALTLLNLSLAEILQHRERFEQDLAGSMQILQLVE